MFPARSRPLLVFVFNVENVPSLPVTVVPRERDCATKAPPGQSQPSPSERKHAPPRTGADSPTRIIL